MIPALTPPKSAQPATQAYLTALTVRGFEGEVSVDWARRFAGAVDNSVYQLTPAALVYPRHERDVCLALSLLNEPEFREVHLTPRGGGTGTNGQSLNTGVVLDLSRHLNHIIEVNLEEGWARVQAGVVLDQLNDHLAPHGVFFAPNLSPSSRATLGGMINTDAAGQGSRVYGKTSDHLLALRCAHLGGEVEVYQRPSAPQTSPPSPPSPPSQREREEALLSLARVSAPLVAEHLPQLDRFVTGYDLKRLYDEERDKLDLTRLIAGSEGTLGVVTEATLRLTPLPRAKRVVLLRYATFGDALGSARALLTREPTSIETIDHNILSLARTDVIYEQVRGALEGEGVPGSLVEREVKAVNLLEFTAPTEEGAQALVDACIKALTPHFGEPNAPLGAYVAVERAEQASLWALRKKGVGLLAAREGKRKPVAFVEDTVVPPERLKEYIEAFTTLLDAEGLEYGMFGHVDVGCLHVRPALNLIDPEDEARLKRVSDGVHALVQRFGGVIWGEHGKGVRSAYSPEVFGPLYPALQEVKALFDPHNQLNPGKVATPAGLSAELMPIESPLRAHHDRDLGAEALEGFAVTVSCNGNAQCLDYHPHHVMCPSSKVTRDRLHSPKGRAMVMRGWLGALSRAGYPLSEAEVSEARPPHSAHSPHSLRLSLLKRAALAPFQAPFKALAKHYRALTSQGDLSHEVYEAMSGCLSCKACATHCPVKVDVPSLKARFLSLYHERYPRPLRDYAVGALEGVAALGSRAPWLFNALSQNPLARLINERVIGLVDAPPLSPRSALSALKAEGALMATPERLNALSDEERVRALILVPDAFNSFFDAPTLISAYRAFKTLGFTPLIAPFSPNGKGLHVKGRLEAFGRVASEHVQRLAPLAEQGVALVVIEPAVALTYGDEYARALGQLPFEVTLPQAWLSERLELINPQLKGTLRDQSPPLSLLGHCTERALAQGAMTQWRALFEHLGAELQVEEVGCCGMCGVFGHEREHQAESMGVYEISWRPTLTSIKSEGRAPLATGYSCRSQVKRAAPQEPLPLHPLVWIAQALQPLTSTS